MGNLYQKVLNLGIKGKSTQTEIKKVLEEKNANIKEDIIGTLPDEIDSINTISAPSSDICQSKIELSFGGTSIERCVFNEKTGIFIAVISDTQTYVTINTKLHYNDLSYMQILQNPGNADANVSYNSFVGTDVDSLFATDEYIFMRLNGDNNNGESLMYYTIDGVHWNKDMSKIITGARGNVTDIIASFPWGFIVQTKNGQYVYDFITKTVMPNTLDLSIPYSNLRALCTDAVAFLVPSDNTVLDVKNIYYVMIDEPYNIRKTVLGGEISRTVKSIASLTKTGRNTLLMLGRTSSGYSVYELFVGTNASNSLVIDHRLINQSASLSTPDKYLQFYGTMAGKYTYMSFNGTDLMYSDDISTWNKAFTLESGYIVCTFFDGTNIHIIDSNMKDSVNVIGIVDSSDVPMYKVFLNHKGELKNGEVGNIHNSMQNKGRICNIMVDASVLFDNKTIFDPRYHHVSFNQVIYYINAYYYIIGYQKHLMLLKSYDGFEWDCIYETSESPIRFTPGIYNRWRLEIIKGRLYLIQVGTTVNGNGPVRIDIASDNTVTLVNEKDTFWQLLPSLIPANMQYLYTACNGVVFANRANMTSNNVTGIIIVNEFEARTLADIDFEAYTYIEVKNKDAAAVIVANDHFIYCADEKIYTSDTFGISSIDPTSIQIYEYDNETLIFLQKTGELGVPFIKFFHINKGELSIDEIPYSALPEETIMFDRRPYLPVATMKDNLLFVYDFNNKELGFIIDLEDEFKFVRFEERCNANTQSFMQYCNGMMFVIDTYAKEHSSYTNELLLDHNWIDIAGNNNGFYAITDGATTGETLWYSYDGLIYNAVPNMIADYKPKYIAGDNTTILTATDVYTDQVVVLDEKYDNVPTAVTIPMKLYIQNVEVQNTPTGTQGFVFGKLSEDAPYNIIFTTTDFETWTEIGITTITDPTIKTAWRDITCNDDDVWAAIASNSTEVITSKDGVEWQNTTMPYDIAWDAIVATNTMFVAVARNDNRAAYSYDGVIWEPFELPKVAEWCGVSYGLVNGVGTLCIIAANTTTVLCGPDIFNLTEYDTIDNLDYVRLIYQDNKFVALARNSRYAAYSKDGINWEMSLMPVKADWKYLLYASGAFVAIDSTTENMASSINGMSWIAETIDEGRTYRLIDYQNDKFIVFEFTGGSSSETSEDNESEYEDYAFKYLGTSDTFKEWIDCVVYNYNLVIGSKEGIVVAKMGSDAKWIDSTLPLVDADLDYDWLKITCPLQEYWSGLISHSNVKVMFSSETNSFMRSTDFGDSWFRMEFPISGVWSAGTFGLNNFLVFSDNLTEYAYSSDFGETWRIDSHGINDTFAYATYQNGYVYLLSKTKPVYYTTTDLENWVTHDIAEPYKKIVYTGTRFIAIGASNTSCYVSDNGDEWINYSITSATDTNDVAAGNNKIIITTVSSNLILLSEDGGETWTTVTLPETNENWKAFFVNNRFILLGDETNHNLVSSDGLNWGIGELYTSADWKFAYNDTNDYSMNRIYAVAQDLNEIGYSYDGKYWYRSSTMSDVLYGNGLYVTFDRSAENDKEVVIFWSKDCVEWFSVKVPLNGKMNDCCFGDGRFVIITDALDNYIYESIDAVTWTIRALNLETVKLKIAHNHIGFAILTDAKTVQLAENRVRFTNTNLPSLMNQVVAESNGNIVILDYSTYTPYIGTKGSNSFDVVTDIEIDNTRNWVVNSTESSIFLTSELDMWIFNTYRNNWYHLEYDISNIVGIQEGILSINGMNEHVGILLANNTIYFITGLYDVNDAIQLIPSGISLGQINGICPSNSTKTLKVFDNTTIWDYDHFDTNAKSYEVIATTIPGISGNIVDMAYANDTFMIITDTNEYATSNDGYTWFTNFLVDDAVGLTLQAGTNFFVGSYELDEKIYYFYSDGTEITYYDFEELYGSDIDVIVTPNSIFIAKYDSVLTELMFYDQTIMLSASGTSKSKYDRINPKKNRFCKGNFVIDSNEENTLLHLDFTPRMVIIRSVTKSASDTFEELVISNSAFMYQNVNDDVESSVNNLELTKNADGANISNLENSRIVTNGVIINNANLDNTTYIYYAFN